MKLGIFTETANSQFVTARQRIQPKLSILKSRLEPINLAGRHNNVLLTFIDKPAEYFHVIKSGKADDIYEVDVGYDQRHHYPPEDDVLLVQFVEGTLLRILESSEAFAQRREELTRVITDWTTEAIGA